MAYPIVHKKFVNLVAFKYEPDKVGTRYDGPISGIVGNEDELKERYKGWEKEIRDVVEARFQP